MFDSTWCKTLFDEELAAEVERRREEYRSKYGELRNHDSDTDESHDHVDPKELPLSKVERPQRDEEKFKDMGLEDIKVITDINDYVYDEKDKLLYALSMISVFVVTETDPPEGDSFYMRKK